MVTTLAGPGGASGNGDGTGDAARFSGPSAVAVDRNGNIYAADGHLIRKITPAGVVTTLAGSTAANGCDNGFGSPQLYTPTGVAVDRNANVYATDTSCHAIRKITPAGVMTTFAGENRSAGSANGTLDTARFRYPDGVAVDGRDNVYVVDSGNRLIRKITPNGVVTTLAAPAGYPQFVDPVAVAVDSLGFVYVLDHWEFTISVIAPGCHGYSSGPCSMKTLFRGSFTYLDADPGTNQYAYPRELAIDVNGNVYLADPDSGVIRMVTAGGTATTVAGTARSFFRADGTGSAARFYSPEGVAVDATGTIVYVADEYDGAIRKGVPALDTVATIDSASGPVGVRRTLGTAPRYATTWKWTLIRRPSGSTAELSSTDIENPTFTPDVADLYVFQLEASNGGFARISTVSLLVAQGAHRRAAAH